MAVQKLIIVGNGSHARHIAATVDDINKHSPNTFEILGSVDDAWEKCDRYTTPRGIHPLLGPINMRWSSVYGNELRFVIAINNSQVRREVWNRIWDKGGSVYLGMPSAPIIHPSVVCARYTGPNELHGVIGAGTVINADVFMGVNVHINIGCTISQSCVIGKHTTISPGVHIAGEVTIGESVHIGTGVSIVNLVKIADNVIIGAGAVVTKDCDVEGGTYVGVPARLVEKDETRTATA